MMPKVIETVVNMIVQRNIFSKLTYRNLILAVQALSLGILAIALRKDHVDPKREKLTGILHSMLN